MNFISDEVLHHDLMGRLVQIFKIFEVDIRSSDYTHIYMGHRHEIIIRLCVEIIEELMSLDDRNMFHLLLQQV